MKVCLRIREVLRLSFFQCIFPSRTIKQSFKDSFHIENRDRIRNSETLGRDLHDPDQGDSDKELLYNIATLAKVSNTRARQLLIRAFRTVWPKACLYDENHNYGNGNSFLHFYVFPGYESAHDPETYGLMQF